VSASAGPSDDHRPTIVFLHATRLTGAQWARQVADLSDEFRCLTPDLPGHGTAAEIPFTLDGAADRVAGLIERFAGGRAIVVGLSLGAYVAMDLAARRPELVAGLVLAGATVEPRGVSAIPYRGLAILIGHLPSRVLDREQAWVFRARYPAATVGPILNDGFWFRGGAAGVRALIGESFRPRLARYPGPTLLINGQLDVLFRMSERSFAAVATHARRLTIRGAGHRSNLDRPRAFSAAVRSFAREVSAVDA
jgi:pimeloyl-ACP methyl ester carboxylesterase